MMRKRIFEVIEVSNKSDKASSIFDYCIIILIVLNIAAVVAASFNDFSVRNRLLLERFELVSVVIFSIEYVLRLWTAIYKYNKSKHPYIKQIFSFLAVIDLLAILPFYLPLFFRIDFRFLRMLRLFRILRILKLNRYNNAIELMRRVFKNEKEKIVTTLFLCVMLLLISASLMYYVENATQPEQFLNIIATIWWAVATLTTVGYGDVYPVTVLGKILSGIIAILGIGLVALPTGIISSGFIGEINDSKKKICPHCGKDI
jgi:voltage-gated potassium channel